LIAAQELVETVAAAVEAARRAGVGKVDAAVVLGSGLSAFADSLDESLRIPYDSLPGFKSATVKGHRGELVYGQLGGFKVLVFSGRMHLYEGIEPWRAGLLPRLAAGLGARLFVVTNASGGVPGKGLDPGDLMRITDQLNLQGTNPLVGPHDERLGARFPDMGQPYDKVLGQRLDELAKRLGSPLKSGVYVGVLGPGYESPAEVRMYGMLGADTVGMSTVGEVLVARQVGLPVVGISCISNIAAGNDGAEVLTHQDVTEVVGAAAQRFVTLLTAAVPHLLEA
jgi:purine-nucleoside phosphorylase